MRKGDNEEQHPGKDERQGFRLNHRPIEFGSQYLTTSAREAKIKAAEINGQPIGADVEQEEDAVLTCHSNARRRQSQWCGSGKTDRGSFRYLAKHDRAPRDLRPCGMPSRI